MTEKKKGIELLGIGTVGEDQFEKRRKGSLNLWVESVTVCFCRVAALCGST